MARPQRQASDGTPANPAFALFRARVQILHRVEAALETPMAFLGLAWLALMLVDLSRGLGDAGVTATTAIWIVFIIDFAVRLILAPRKLRYLQRNWLTAIALLLPALRILRFARIFRALARLRGLQLVRIIGSLNRGMRVLGRTMRRRGFGYVLGLTAMVTLAGAAGMLHFEQRASDGSLPDFWTALWWSAMLVTTMGSEYWPKTTEGRALCLFLAIYAFAVFGYVTGAIATFLVGRDVEDADYTYKLNRQLDSLTTEIARLREDIRQMQQSGGPPDPV